ncbi:hypothetical protein PRZ48_002702 [Zasmidium cellare]|uniref:Uncharacterized protein n=1 Tax=Zasmidium cellare TaxID=395010 RepID=A0ABR0ETD6_ZASCE|nr:hypothetical protein PRZ48_002702 [Zasmidium cellare]
MCATTPSSNLTYYGPGAVITAYAGTRDSGIDQSSAGQKTAVVNGHTFTSGTAYISIASVWASDRCSSTHGTVVTDAILAMPSESVLSLRYTQNHFESYFDQTVTQTGYPVSYADFNEPVPYSAWNGQSTCRAADDGYSCQTIYEGMYRPQLAIPPGIRDLSPDFKGCAFWYRGLYDPPLALTEAASEDIPTPPGHQGGHKATAMEDTTAVATEPALMSESQRSHPGSRPQNQIAKPTSTSQSPRQGLGSDSGSSPHDVDDGNTSYNDSQNGSDSEEDRSPSSAQHSSAHGPLPSHHQGDAHVTQSEGFPQGSSVMASDSPHRIIDGDGSIGNTVPFDGSGEPTQSLTEDTYTTPGLHQGAVTPTYDGMGSSRHSNQATTDSQASNRDQIGGAIQSVISVDGVVPETAIETGALPASYISNADARPSGDVQHDDNAQGPIPTPTGTGRGTTGPREQHSGSMAAFPTGTEERPGKSASAATTTSNGSALDQSTQQSDMLTNSVTGGDSNAPLTSKPTSSMIELQSTGQTTAAFTLSRSSSMSSRIAPSTQFLLSIIAVAVLFQMAWTAG